MSSDNNNYTKSEEIARIKGFAQGYEQACIDNNFGIKETKEDKG